ncbi:winged helix-turn-helix transcriptional regulator [Kitasatospora sp. NPDC058170]|uniref:winged helix-turn-helix transcriptional regulator n=1 Tax=Kitasatospora sp. NPDC058170 TaxID=3346364 RepID=UPI0036DAE972
MAEHEEATEQVRTVPENCTTAPTCTNVEVALTRVFTLLGKRWTGMIVAVLTNNGPGYFSELRRAIPGISERMLSDRLTELSDAGLVLRQVDEGPPLRVSYRLTEAGAALRPALTELALWADQHLPASALKPHGTC